MIILKADLSAFHTVFEKAGSNNEPVIFSTDTIYGIGSSVHNSIANQKIYEIKGRELNKPFPVLVGSIEQLLELAEPTENALEFIDSCPIPCTVVMKAKEGVNSLMKLNGNIAIRVVKSGVVSDFLKSYGAVTATSANFAGVEYVHNIEHIIKTFQAKVNYFLYATSPQTTPSAIVDFSLTPPKIIRDSVTIPLTL